MTYSHTCSGSDRLLFVSVQIYNATLVTVSAVTYNGVAMSKAAGITAAYEGATQDGEIWYLKNPASGANNVVVTLSGIAAFTNSISSSYTGVLASGIYAVGTAQNPSNSTSAPACNVTLGDSTCWLMGLAFGRAFPGGVSASTATTARQTIPNIAMAVGDSGGAPGAGSRTLAWTQGASIPYEWPAVVSVSFSANAAGSTVWSVTTNESASATDSSSASSILVSAATEATSATDSSSAAAILISALTESVTATDSAASAAVWPAAVSESVGATDTQTALAILAAIISENVTASDLAAAVLIAVAAVNEAASATDQAASTAVWPASASEAASATDTPSATYAVTAAAVMVAQIAEAGSATDQASAAVQLVALLTEQATAVDAVAGSQSAIYTVSIAELANALDTLAATFSGGGASVIARMQALDSFKWSIKLQTSAVSTIALSDAPVWSIALQAETLDNRAP